MIDIIDDSRIGIPGDGLADLEVTGDQLDRLCPFKEIAQWCQPKKYRYLP